MQIPTWSGMEVNQKPFGILYTQGPRGLSCGMQTSLSGVQERHTVRFPQSYSSSADAYHHLHL